MYLFHPAHYRTGISNCEFNGSNYFAECNSPTLLGKMRFVFSTRESRKDGKGGNSAYSVFPCLPRKEKVRAFRDVRGSKSSERG